MEAGLFPLLPMLVFTVIYLGIFAVVVTLIVIAVRKSFRLKEEQNDLLRQLVINTSKEKQNT